MVEAAGRCKTQADNSMDISISHQRLCGRPRKLSEMAMAASLSAISDSQDIDFAGNFQIASPNPSPLVLRMPRLEGIEGSRPRA